MNKLKTILKNTFFYCTFLISLVFITNLIFFGFEKFKLPKINFLWFYLILNILFIFYILIRKKSKEYKIFWIIFITIIPFYGHLFFVFFTFNYRNQKSKFLYQKNKMFNYEQHNIIAPFEIVNEQSHISKRGIYNCDIKLYENNFFAFKDLFNDLKNAKTSIHILYFEVENSNVWNQIKNIIIEKAKQGLEIRIIFDNVGRSKLPWYEFKDLTNYKINVKIQNKVYFPFIGVHTFYVDHRKMTIIDNKIVYSGGSNLTDDYISINPKLGHVFDFNFKLWGQAINSYQLLFLHTWNLINNKNNILNFEKYLSSQNYLKTNNFSLLVEDGPEIKEKVILNMLLKFIDNAKFSIEIATPYLIPPKELRDAIFNASKRGVKISIFTGQASDAKITYLANKYWFKEFETKNIHLHIIKNSYLHSKFCLFDSQVAIIGTFNFDYRSMFIQWETANIFYGSITKQIKTVFSNYQKLPSLDLKKVKKYKLIPKFVIKLLTPIL